MADLSISAHVTRANLDPALADLDLNDGTNYTLSREVEVGKVTFRRETVTSPFVPGRIEVGAVKDAADGGLMVFVGGASHATLSTNIETLLTAFTDQAEYTVKLQVEGQFYYWRCERADYEVGFATEALNARYVPVRLSFFRRPIPEQGPF